MADGGDGEQDRAEQSEREGEKGPAGSTTLRTKLSDGSGTAAIMQNGGAAAGSELELVNGNG